MRLWLGLMALIAAACTTAAPPVLTPDQVPAAFVAATQATDRTMHMEWTGTYSMGALGALTTPFSASIDFSASDYAGSVSAAPNAPDEKPGANNQSEIAFVGGQGYQRTPYSSGWQRIGGAAPSLDPFQGLDLGEVQYVGQEVRNGATVQHVHITDVSGVASTIFNGLSGSSLGPVHFDATNSMFDVYVDDAARPVGATLNLGTDANPSEFGAIRVTSTYQFSNWGAEFYIVAPPIAP
jgi:hypothetical protein